MEGNQDWYRSRGVWGGIITVLAAIAGLFGIVISEEERVALTDALLVIATGIGGVLAFIGRIRADRKIR